jgi:hypothetical protein
MRSNDSDRRVPVLLIRTGPTEITAVTPGSPPQGWHEITGAAIVGVASWLKGVVGGTETRTTAGRVFTMRPEDLPAWDRLTKHGGEYAYGTLWGPDGKIAKNVAIREAGSAPGFSQTLPFDAVAVASAVAAAQLQASIQRLTDLVEQVAQDLRAVLHFLRLEQESEVLAAVETIDDLYRRYKDELAIGSVDWDRIAGLEQILKRQHRQIVGELAEIERQMRFTSIESAKHALGVGAERVQNLLTLEWFLLRAWARWAELMLAAKSVRGELTLAAVREARSLVDGYLHGARTAVEGISLAEGEIRGRGVLEMLFSNGLVWGSHVDDGIRREALDRREKIRIMAQAYKKVPMEATGVLQLTAAPDPGETLAIAPWGATPSASS